LQDQKTPHFIKILSHFSILNIHDSEESIANNIKYDIMLNVVLSELLTHQNSQMCAF
jgi:hypothetical protein